MAHSILPGTCIISLSSVSMLYVQHKRYFEREITFPLLLLQYNVIIVLFYCVIVVTLFLCLVNKLNFIIGKHVEAKTQYTVSLHMVAPHLWIENIKKQNVTLLLTCTTQLGLRTHTDFLSCHYSLSNTVNNDYLHGIYIALGIVSNLEMNSSIWEGVRRLHANTTPTHIRYLASADFGICWGFWNQSPANTKR